MKKFFIVLLSSFLLLFSGCVEEKVDNISKNKPYIAYNINSFPQNFLQFNNKESVGKDLIYALFDGLVTMDKSGEIVPSLAKNWEVSEDGITYTFHIKEEALWSDGSAISAEDFVKFFSEMFSSKVDNIYYSQLNCIYGLEDYHLGKVKFDGVAIRAVDSKILEIRLNKVNSDFLKILAQPIFNLRTNTAFLEDWKSNYSNIKYSGPFAIKNFNTEEGILLEKNKNYWDRDEVTEEKILLNASDTAEIALAKLETSKIDILMDPPVSEAKRVLQSEDTLVINTDNTIGVVFNVKTNSITKDINLRKAIRESINPIDIIEKALPEFCISSQGNTAYETVNVFKNNAVGYTVNNEEGKNYLSKVQGQQGKSIRLVSLNGDKYKRISKGVSDSIKNNLGINVVQKFYDDLGLQDVINSGEFDILLWEYKSEYDKDMAFLSKWNSYNKENSSGYSNIEFDNMLIKAQLETDYLKKKNYVNECKSILNKDLPFIPIFNDVTIITKSHSVEGIRVNIFGNLDFKGIHRIYSEY